MFPAVLVERVAGLGEFSEEKGGGCREKNAAGEQSESGEPAGMEYDPDERTDGHQCDPAEGEADDESVADDGDGGASPAGRLSGTLADEFLIDIVWFIHNGAERGSD